MLGGVRRRSLGFSLRRLRQSVSADDGDPLDAPISWLVQNREASVRLLNCVDANRSLGDLTIRQFLSEPDKTRHLLFGISRLGRKTADELSAMVAAVISEPSRRPTAAAPESVSRIAFRALVDFLRPISFPAALLTIGTSARLRNGLKAIEASRAATPDDFFPEADLGAVLADWPMVRRRLLARPNFGRTTVSEIERIIERIVGTKLAMISASVEGPVPVSIDDLTEERLSPKFHDALIAAGPSLGAHHSDISVLLHGIDPNCRLSPCDHVDAVVAQLPQKEQDTLVGRYGLNGKDLQTLEELASRFHVTRERVRQVQAKALAQLRIGASRKAFERLLEAELDVVWNVLSAGSALLMPADVQDRRADIPRHFMLAVDVVYGSLMDCLNGNAYVALGGWLRDASSAQEIQAGSVRLATWAQVAPGPVPVAMASLASDVPEWQLAIAAKLRTEFHIFEGYFCPRQLSVQTRRTCRLHRRAMESDKWQLFDICTLRNAYAAMYPDDDTFSRSILLQLQRAPHLFFKLFDSIWVPLGTDMPPPHDAHFGGMPFARFPMLAESAFEPGTIGAWLHAALTKNGPSRAVDLRLRAEVEFPQKIAQSSIGAVLQSNPDFVRIAPGVYGLQRNATTWSDPFRSVAPSMLSDTQCRYYAQSRMAGDPMDTYPGWNFHLEMALCVWASSNTSDDIYRSILAVSEPSEWPLGPDEAATWLNRKRVLGSYRLRRSEPPGAMRLPSAPDFLAAAIYLSLTGSIAWTTVNRTAQRRVDDQKAASALALLVRFGMASSPDHWQGRHHVLPRAAEVVSAIVADLSRTGRISWDEGTLNALRAEPAHAQVTTANPGDVQAMLAGGNADSDSGRMMNGGPAPDVESLFSSDEWGALFQSSEQLAWDVLPIEAKGKP